MQTHKLLDRATHHTLSRLLDAFFTFDQVPRLEHWSSLWCSVTRNCCFWKWQNWQLDSHCFSSLCLLRWVCITAFFLQRWHVWKHTFITYIFMEFMIHTFSCYIFIILFWWNWPSYRFFPAEISRPMWTLQCLWKNHKTGEAWTSVYPHMRPWGNLSHSLNYRTMMSMFPFDSLRNITAHKLCTSLPLSQNGNQTGGGRIDTALSTTKEIGG